MVVDVSWFLGAGGACRLGEVVVEFLGIGSVREAENVSGSCLRWNDLLGVTVV